MKGKTKMKVKFMWNGIKVDDTLYRAHYSCGPYTTNSGLPEGTITVYAKDYKSLPQIEGLQIENDSDSMTDYFETDRLRIKPDSKYYNEAKAAYDKMNEHNEKRFAKKYGKTT
jgi:hypothetical protein